MPADRRPTQAAAAPPAGAAGSWARAPAPPTPVPPAPTPPAARPPGPWLAAYLGLSALAAPALALHLARRTARGREDPARVSEKRGRPSRPRPPGPLVWLHAVGVGEALVLPGLARALADARPGLGVLVTSSSRSSAAALAPALPPGAVHQFLPLDARPWRRRFLDHWRPDLAVFAERDLWPGLIWEADRRGIPLALVNARVDARSARAKARVRGLYADLLGRFALIEAQDAASAVHLAALGAPAGRLAATGSLKRAAPPLPDRPERAAVAAALRGRRLWLAASTHPGEESAAARAHRLLRARDPAAVLVIAPRDPARAGAAAAAAAAEGLPAARLPAGNLPLPEAPVLIVPRIGELGLWYRLADAAFVGGSLAPVGGHNPWEPARLGAAILHGPEVANFAADYAELAAARAARRIDGAEALAAALADPELALMPPRARALAVAAEAMLPALAARLLALVPGR
jgi:3-deoxy-D-manno-octulosonic-acid transferase